MSLSRFGQLIDLARRHEPGLAAWLTGAQERWQAGEKLNVALGLSLADAVRARNAALNCAADTVRAELPEASDWTVAGRLEKEIDRFETNVLPRLRKGFSPERLSPVAGQIHQAFASGARMLRCRRKLFDLIKTR